LVENTKINKYKKTIGESSSTEPAQKSRDYLRQRLSALRNGDHWYPFLLNISDYVLEHGGRHGVETVAIVDIMESEYKPCVRLGRGIDPLLDLVQRHRIPQFLILQLIRIGICRHETANGCRRAAKARVAKVARFSRARCKQSSGSRSIRSGPRAKLSSVPTS